MLTTADAGLVAQAGHHHHPPPPPPPPGASSAMLPGRLSAHASTIVAAADAETGRLQAALEACERELRRERDAGELLRGRMIEMSQELGRESRRRERAEERAGAVKTLETTRGESKDALISKLQRQVDEDQASIASLKKTLITHSARLPQGGEGGEGGGGAAEVAPGSRSASPAGGRLSPFPPKHDRPNEVLLSEMTREADGQILGLNRQLNAALVELQELKRAAAAQQQFQQQQQRQPRSLLQQGGGGGGGGGAGAGSAPLLARGDGEFSAPRPTPGELYQARMELHKAHTQIDNLRKELGYWKGHNQQQQHTRQITQGGQQQQQQQDPGNPVSPSEIARLQREEASLRSEVAALRQAAADGSGNSPPGRRAARSASPSQELALKAARSQSEAETLQQALSASNIEAEKLRSRYREKAREAELLGEESQRLREAMSGQQASATDVAVLTQERDELREGLAAAQVECNSLEVELGKSRADCGQLAEDLRGLMSEMEEKRRMTEAVVVKAAEFQEVQETLRREMGSDKEAASRLRQRVAELEEEAERAGLRVETERTARRTSTQLAAVFSLKISELLNQLNGTILPELPQPSPIHHVVMAHTQVFNQLREHCDTLVGQASPEMKPLMAPPGSPYDRFA